MGQELKTRQCRQCKAELEAQKQEKLSGGEIRASFSCSQCGDSFMTVFPS